MNNSSGITHFYSYTYLFKRFSLNNYREEKNKQKEAKTLKYLCAFLLCLEYNTCENLCKDHYGLASLFRMLLNFRKIYFSRDSSISYNF